MALALAASRDIAGGDRAMRAGTEGWTHAGNVGTFLLYGRRVGFIGYGNLARALRSLLAAFDCPISLYDPWLSTGYVKSMGLSPVTLEQLLETSQVIFVLAPPTVENGTLLSRSMLERIQPASVLVLISRAFLVDFDALTELVSLDASKPRLTYSRVSRWHQNTRFDAQQVKCCPRTERDSSRRGCGRSGPWWWMIWSRSFVACRRSASRSPRPSWQSGTPA